MDIRIDPEFERLIRPLTDDEKNGLRRKLVAEGCWQPFAVWTAEDGDGVPTLLDGHNRYAWCLEQHATFTLYEVPGIHTRDDAKHWIIQNQLSQRNLTPYESIDLAERDVEILKRQALAHQQAGGVLTNLSKPIDVTETTAQKSGTSRTQVTKKKFIDRYGTEDEKEALRRGDATIHGVHTAILERQQLDVWSRVNAGEKQREIAQILGMHQSQVSKLLQKARDIYGGTLGEEIEAPAPEPETPSEPHTVRDLFAEADARAAEGMGETADAWAEEPDEYLGECYKECYGPRVLTKGSVEEFGVRGVYVCTGCGYAYPPFCAPGETTLQEHREVDEEDKDEEPESLDLPLGEETSTPTSTPPASQATVDESNPQTNQSVTLFDPPQQGQGEPTFQNGHDAYRKWLDLYEKIISLTGGIQDIGGIHAIYQRMSSDQCRRLHQEITEISDAWIGFKNESAELLDDEILIVNGEVVHG